MFFLLHKSTDNGIFDDFPPQPLRELSVIRVRSEGLDMMALGS